ncbi:MAG: FAD-dependent oxidoreductase, partial [Spirochaetales bacterium]|nr:FAD-dependent oxidoreductase [Spirochaetales bacterium]
RKLTEDLREAVERGEYSAPVLKEQKRLLNYLRGKHWQLPGRRNEMMSVLSRVLRVDPLDPFDLTRAEREGREQARQAADFCCRYAPGFEEAYLLDTSAHLGVRSSRRIRGAETVTTEDAVRLKRYTDGIARCSFHIDVWPADSYERKPGAEDCADAFTITGFPREERNRMIMEGGYFDIRYGALVASGIDNLMMAGRCISADHFAESSLRIQQTCMATGEAAGVSAALSIRHETTPRELDPGIVVEQLGASRSAVEPAFDELRGT